MLSTLSAVQGTERACTTSVVEDSNYLLSPNLKQARVKVRNLTLVEHELVGVARDNVELSSSEWR